MKTLLYPLVLFCLFICFADCNPECSSSGNMTISTDFNPAGYEFLIKATPLSSLKNKRVFFNKIQAETRFWDTVGLICKVPTNISIGKTTLRVEDDDCVETFNFDVANNDVFKKNPNYIFPQTPEIVIPTFISSGFPASINNAWLSPENIDYCIWFTMRKDSTRNPNGSYNVFDIQSIDENKSFEQCTKCNSCSSIDQSPLYKKNTMQGFYDTTNRVIHYWIQRANGIEEFEGRFIDDSKTKYASRNFIYPCATKDSTRKSHMILLTSKKTGRQTVIFKN